ncbi:hypothetical protein EC968_008404 [Mortierella alpina]|nr:hypothetical protein EC968_008404 [Mortierella alpina]
MVMLLPEMVHLITKTLSESPKKGVPIASEWHCAIPPDPHQQVLPVNLTMNEFLEYEKSKYAVMKSLTLTDPSETLFGADYQELAPPRKFPMLEVVAHLGLDSIQSHKIISVLEEAFFFPCLRSLVLTNAVLDRVGAGLLWRLFWQLEVLSLMNVHLLDMSGVREYMKHMRGKKFSRLKKLYLHFNDGGFPMEDQCRLILDCPNLTAFHWALPEGHEGHAFTVDFMELRRSYQLEEIRETEELHIVGEMDDPAIALAINNMQDIRSLSISVDDRFGLQSLGAMCTIAAHLRRFESHSDLMSGIAIDLVLSSCPLLHTLIARTVTAFDTTKDKKRIWFCAPSLKVLCVSFVFESHESRLQDEVCEKLAQLTQLEQLIMNEPCNKRPGTFGLRLRLGQGLERLSTLKNLKYLSTLDDFAQPARKEELMWIAQHWPFIHGDVQIIVSTAHQMK